MKICFWVQEPITELYYTTFGIDRLTNAGHEVHIWDFSPWFRPEFYESSKHLRFYHENYHYINSFTEYQKQIKTTKPIPIIDFIFGRKESNTIYEYAKPRGFYIIRCYQGIIARHYFKPSFFSSLFFQLKSDPALTISKLGKNLNIFNNRKKNLIDIQPDLLVVSGEFTDQVFSINNSTRKLFSHSWDYDKFLENNAKPDRLINGEYLLFTDTYEPYHLDNKLTGKSYITSAERYYPALNKFFERVEKVFQLPMVIAAHPTSEYEKIGNPYDGRKIIKHKTSQLVRYAKIVFTQSCTSDNFSVLWQKPLILIATSDQLYSRARWNIDATCRAFKTDYINVNSFNGNLDLWALAQRPIDRYDFYRNGFIKKDGTPEKNSWDLLIDYIEKEIKVA